MIAIFIAMLAALLCRDILTRTYDKYKFNGTLKRLRAKLRGAGIPLALFLATSAMAQSADSLPALPQKVVADYVEILREHDSTEAADIFLVPFEREIDSVAKRHKLPPDLLAAFIQEESAFDQWAARYEPLYAKKKIVIAQARAWSKKWRGVPTVYTEVTFRSTSFGLLQPMGQLAREQGFDARYLIELIKPFNSIDQGARHLRDKLRKYGSDTLSAISAYNQGNNRKKNGLFKNVRYVYRLTVAWQAYRKLYRERDETYNVDTTRDGSARLWASLWMDTAWLQRTAAGDWPLYQSLRAALRDGATGFGKHQLRLSARTDTSVCKGEQDTLAADNLPSKPVLLGFSLLLGLCVLYVLFATQPGHGKRLLDAGATPLRSAHEIRSKVKGHGSDLPTQGFAHRHS